MKKEMTWDELRALRATIVKAYDNHGYDVRSVLGRAAHSIAADDTLPADLRNIAADLVIASGKPGFGRPTDRRTRLCKQHNETVRRLQGCDLSKDGLR